MGWPLLAQMLGCRAARRAAAATTATPALRLHLDSPSALRAAAATEGAPHSAHCQGSRIAPKAAAQATGSRSARTAVVVLTGVRLLLMRAGRRCLLKFRMEGYPGCTAGLAGTWAGGARST